MTFEQLRAFCLQVRPIQASIKPLMKPMLDEGYAYATDGKIAIRTKAPEGVPAEAYGEWPEYHYATVRNALRNAPARWFTLAVMPAKPAAEPCPECAGTGKTQCEACENLAACIDCNGAGKRTPDRLCSLQGEYVMLFHLLRILDLPDLQLGPVPRAIISKGDGFLPQRFRFEGGDGVIMPCRPITGLDVIPLQLKEVTAQG